MRMSRTINIVYLVVLMAFVAACAPRQQTAKPAPPPVVTAPPPDTTATNKPTPPPPPPPVKVEDTRPVTPPIAEDSIAGKSIDEINRDSPLKPVFFPVDSSDLDDSGRAVASANADALKKYATWVITVEGHADERGTAEYNLALGERRALTVKTYLVSLGISAERLKTVSYGKEFPFDPGHDEAAWSKNRRAHFVITAK
jgi:peptidoglycan-associated lipoprotein